MKRHMLLIAVMLFATSTMLLGSGTVGGGTKSDMNVTKNMKGTIAKIDLEENVVLLKTEDEKVYQFQIVKKTKMKAHKKSALASRKNIALTDFVEGQTVQITYKSTEPQTAVELRLLPSEMSTTS